MSEISLDNVLRVQEYRDLSAVRDDVRAIATAMTAKAATLAAPTAMFRKVPVYSCEGASLRLSTGTSFKADVFGRVLRHCDQVLPFILALTASSGQPQRMNNSASVASTQQTPWVTSVFLSFSIETATSSSKRLPTQRDGIRSFSGGPEIPSRVGPAGRGGETVKERNFRKQHGQVGGESGHGCNPLGLLRLDQITPKLTSRRRAEARGPRLQRSA